MSIRESSHSSAAIVITTKQDVEVVIYKDKLLEFTNENSIQPSVIKFQEYINTISLKSLIKLDC